MNDQANANDGAAKGTDTIPAPAGAAPPPDATATPAAPAATHGGQRQAFAPAGVFATGVGGRRVLWPVAIGAISVALGTLKLLGLIGHVLQLGAQLALYGGAVSGPIFGGNLWIMVYTNNYLVTGIIGGLLLPAGLLLWRQGRLGPRMHIICAILAIPPNIFSLIGQIMFYPPPMGMPTTQWVVWSISPIWSATVGMVYPVFLLIWFSREKVKTETRLWR
jgi:hypothetical protein